MNAQDLQKLKELEQAASTGPWVSSHHSVFAKDNGRVCDFASTRGHYESEQANRDFIAALRNVAPGLIAIAERTSSAGSAVVMSDAQILDLCVKDFNNMYHETCDDWIIGFARAVLAAATPAAPSSPIPTEPYFVGLLNAKYAIVGRTADGRDINLPIFGDGSKDGKTLLLVSLPEPTPTALPEQKPVGYVSAEAPALLKQYLDEGMPQSMRIYNDRYPDGNITTPLYAAAQAAALASAQEGQEPVAIPEGTAQALDSLHSAMYAAFCAVDDGKQFPIIERAVRHAYFKPEWETLKKALSTSRAAQEADAPKVLTIDKIREAGGIVHKDGNIFFTNLDLLNKALALARPEVLSDGPAGWRNSFQNMSAPTDGKGGANG